MLFINSPFPITYAKLSEEVVTTSSLAFTSRIAIWNWLPCKSPSRKLRSAYLDNEINLQYYSTHSDLRYSKFPTFMLLNVELRLSRRSGEIRNAVTCCAVTPRLSFVPAKEKALVVVLFLRYG